MNTTTSKERSMPEHQPRPLPVEREIKLEGVRHISGVTFDGRRVWMAINEGDLVALDPERGIEVARHAGTGCEAGLSFDGEALWAICGAEIRRIDPDSGKILSRIPSPAPGELSGMAYAEGYLWIGQYQGKTVLKLDPKTGKVVKKVERDRFVTGVSFAEGELWHASASGVQGKPIGMLHRLDPETLEERARYLVADTVMISGLEREPGRQRFWAGGGGQGVLRVVAQPKG